MVRDVKRIEDRDRVWVEVQESLGDFHWTRANQQNWGVAWPYYQSALAVAYFDIPKNTAATTA